jgi:hypothetical protein
VKELKMYIDYLKNEIGEVSNEVTTAQIKKLNLFKNNLLEGISYYENLFSSTHFFENLKKEIQNQLQFYKAELSEIKIPELVLV